MARPYYAEGLRLLQEGVADHVTLDALMRESGGFKMGPFELMDLIGHDVNYAVTSSVFDAFYGDSRFQPSLIQLELVNAGFLGRKSGRGFYDYREGASKVGASVESACARPSMIKINTTSSIGAALAKRLQAAGAVIEVTTELGDGQLANIDGAALYLTSGKTATALAAENGCADTLVIDLMLDPSTATKVAIGAAHSCGKPAIDDVVGMLQCAGFAVSLVADSPGLVVMRTVAMLANEACDCVHQQVCSPQAVDIAMKGGVGYPIGPLEWADRIGGSKVMAVLDHLVEHYGEPRYRPSARLRHCNMAGIGLL